MSAAIDGTALDQVQRVTPAAVRLYDDFERALYTAL